MHSRRLVASRCSSCMRQSLDEEKGAEVKGQPHRFTSTVSRLITCFIDKIPTRRRDRDSQRLSRRLASVCLAPGERRDTASLASRRRRPAAQEEIHLNSFTERERERDQAATLMYTDTHMTTMFVQFVFCSIYRYIENRIEESKPYRV